MLEQHRWLAKSTLALTGNHLYNSAIAFLNPAFEYCMLESMTIMTFDQVTVSGELTLAAQLIFIARCNL